MTGNELKGIRVKTFKESRAVFARLLGVSWVSLWRWEEGKLPIPDWVSRVLFLYRAVSGEIPKDRALTLRAKLLTAKAK